MTVRELQAQLALLPTNAEVRVEAFGRNAPLIAVGLTRSTRINCSPSPWDIAFLSGDQSGSFTQKVVEERILTLRTLV